MFLPLFEERMNKTMLKDNGLSKKDYFTKDGGILKGKGILYFLIALHCVFTFYIFSNPFFGLPSFMESLSYSPAIFSIDALTNTSFSGQLLVIVFYLLPSLYFISLVLRVYKDSKLKRILSWSCLIILGLYLLILQGDPISGAQQLMNSFNLVLLLLFLSIAEFGLYYFKKIKKLY